MTDHNRRIIAKRRGWIERTWKRIVDYRFYRSLNQGVIEAWQKSALTL